MNKEELKKMFIESLNPIFVDKEAQDDKDIRDWYMDVCCVCAEEYAESKDEVIKTQKELIDVLTDQVVDLSMMSKIELGDDVINKINRLKNLLNEQTR